MTPADCAKFIGTIAAFDPKAPQPSRDTSKAWASLLYDIELDEALTVATEHYRRTSDTITPAAIIAGVRARRRDTLDRAYVPGQCVDPGLQLRLEALADTKAVDRAVGPTPLPTARQRPDLAERTVAAAMRRGAQARQRQLEAPSDASGDAS